MTQPAEQTVLGWLGEPSDTWAHFYKSRMYSGVAVSECGQIRARHKLKAMFNLPRCDACNTGIHTPGLRLKKLGGY